ncbi:hypothetical protein FMEXI_6520 [Fusarium mexicanum]|uniref:Uncharacterized protein n=1 Tax=Fusarium mexicanum TaxID=751941 RepID=A0A8H5IY34_9HYPO|nr:hypothetical protein FMEXI_6520 [Fusarium mexicanum]
MPRPSISVQTSKQVQEHGKVTLPLAGDFSHPDQDSNTQIIAWDAEPIDLNFCPQDVIVKKTSQKLLSSSNSNIQPNLWSDGASLEKDPNDYSDNGRTFDWYYQESSYDKGKRPYYASSVLNGTVTGVNRHHAARMDSVASCYLTETFSKECKGGKPFAPSFSEGWLNVDICAEGSYDTVAWNTNRNKQEHKETLWLSMKWDIPEDQDSSGQFGNNNSYVLTCDSVSSRGWFQLPNNANGGHSGPLRDKWPSWRELKDEFNDNYIDSPQTKNYKIIAINRATLIRDPNEKVTAQALEKAMFFANEALLTTAASLSQKRSIFYSPGTAVMKPKKDLAAVISVTTIIFFQAMALCVLMWFILRAPMWTQTLDADALAQTGGQLKEWGGRRPDLRRIDGVVGVDEILHQAETSWRDCLYHRMLPRSQNLYI